MLIDYKNVNVYQDAQLVLQDVNFEVGEGEFVYITGKVGTGKSSFLKTLYGEIPVKEGDAKVLDYDMAELKRRHLPDLRKNHLSGLPTADRPHRRCQPAFRVESHGMEEQTGHQPANQRCARVGGHGNQRLQDAIRVVWRRAAAHRHCTRHPQPPQTHSCRRANGQPRHRNQPTNHRTVAANLQGRQHGHHDNPQHHPAQPVPWQTVQLRKSPHGGSDATTKRTRLN